MIVAMDANRPISMLHIVISHIAYRKQSCKERLCASTHALLPHSQPRLLVILLRALSPLLQLLHLQHTMAQRHSAQLSQSTKLHIDAMWTHLICTYSTIYKNRGVHMTYGEGEEEAD